jgi:dihydroorotate dehydrogenase electron transfer subunit
MHKPHRDTIELEAAEIISQQAFDGDQYVLRLQAPSCAATARAGQFAHLTCDPALAMRRPLSIMRVNPDSGWVDFLYKVVGEGTRLLSRRQTGDTISVLGPIGQPFSPDPERPRSLLLGGGVGMPPMLFLAEHLKQTGDFKPLVLLGSEVPFPFQHQPSRIMLPGIPDGVIGSMPLLEDWGIPSRLASLQGYLLEAVAALAREYDLPCQVSLEEYMACAVGGCAGCVVQVSTDAGPAMKRVCVDGPVFDAYSVFQ